MVSFILMPHFLYLYICKKKTNIDNNDNEKSDNFTLEKEDGESAMKNHAENINKKNSLIVDNVIYENKEYTVSTITHENSTSQRIQNNTEHEIVVNNTEKENIDTLGENEKNSIEYLQTKSSDTDSYKDSAMGNEYIKTILERQKNTDLINDKMNETTQSRTVEEIDKSFPIINSINEHENPEQVHISKIERNVDDSVFEQQIKVASIQDNVPESDVNKKNSVLVEHATDFFKSISAKQSTTNVCSDFLQNPENASFSGQDSSALVLTNVSLIYNMNDKKDEEEISGTSEKNYFTTFCNFFNILLPYFVIMKNRVLEKSEGDTYRIVFSDDEKTIKEINLDKAFEMISYLPCIIVAIVISFIIASGYYYTCHSGKQHLLLLKLNMVERNLLASSRETKVLKYELLETRNKLTSIEDNSFGSNDMILALKKKLEIHDEEKRKLQKQIVSLEKELENATEVGLELNKIISDLLNSQSGEDSSIINSVEELQKQLNEQQNTIFQINGVLAAKSKENSELLLLLSEKTNQFQKEINKLRQQNEDLENSRKSLVAQINEAQNHFSKQLSESAKKNCSDIEKLNGELEISKKKNSEIHEKWTVSEAKVQALEEYLGSLESDKKIGVVNITDIANLKAEKLVLTKEMDCLKEILESELDAKQLLDVQVKTLCDEVNSLKQECCQLEKEKLEAQTRLEVLSSYFKEKEAQLQKDLSIKEAIWLKQQGETTSTIERVRLMQDEIQSLRSQNDSLRAEVEAQSAAYKAQISLLENRTHEIWLAARHSERKYEEARIEAATLRRKLTSLGTNINASGAERETFVEDHKYKIAKITSVDDESSESALLSSLPLPPPFIPPPFIAPPHPFMPLPLPPVPSGEMRSPPLGRLISPLPLLSPSDDTYVSNISANEQNRLSPKNSRCRYNENTNFISDYDIETDFSLSSSFHMKDEAESYRYRESKWTSGTPQIYSPSVLDSEKIKRKLKSNNIFDSNKKNLEW